MTDEELKALVTSHEAYMHTRINGAYYAGVRKCIDIFNKYNERWRQENDGAELDDISPFPTEKCREEMTKEFSTLYV